MAAYFIAFAKIKDPAKMTQYAQAAGPTIAAAGGTVVARGKFVEALAGNMSADSSLIAKFDSATAARAWYQSADYQKLIPLRDEALTATFVVIEEIS
jgi:uncharacterized protein (DUF1330 family)